MSGKVIPKGRHARPIISPLGFGHAQVGEKVTTEVLLIGLVGNNLLPVDFVGIGTENHAPVNHSSQQVGVDGPDPQFAMRAAPAVCFMGTPPICEVVNETHQNLVLVVRPECFIQFHRH